MVLLQLKSQRKSEEGQEELGSAWDAKQDWDVVREMLGGKRSWAVWAVP